MACPGLEMCPAFLLFQRARENELRRRVCLDIEAVPKSRRWKFRPGHTQLGGWEGLRRPEAGLWWLMAEPRCLGQLVRYSSAVLSELPLNAATAWAAPAASYPGRP